MQMDQRGDLNTVGVPGYRDAGDKQAETLRQVFDQDGRTMVLGLSFILLFVLSPLMLMLIT
jgi:hypothetical protein